MVKAEQWTAEHSRRFGEHPATVRGYIRYELTRDNIQETLGDFLKQSRRAVDIGGGEGNDAFWLANLTPSHEVTLVEPDGKSLKTAKFRHDGLIKAFIQGDAQTTLEKCGPEAFELLLSHGVLQYLDNPHSELKKMADLLEPGSYISVLTAGKFGKLHRHKDDQAKINRLLLDGKFINNLGIQTTAYLPQEVDSMLTSVGFETVDWFGNRIITDDDDRPVSEVSTLELNRLFLQEKAVSKDPSRRPEGQMLHFIARKIT